MVTSTSGSNWRLSEKVYLSGHQKRSSITLRTHAFLLLPSLLGSVTGSTAAGLLRVGRAPAANTYARVGIAAEDGRTTSSTRSGWYRLAINSVPASARRRASRTLTGAPATESQ